MEEIIFVTHNKGKIAAAEEYLKEVNFKIYEYELEEPRSDDIRYISRYKVKESYKIVKKPCISLDCGFWIDALNGFPRAFVNFALDTIGIKGFLKLMEGKENRNCRFTECLSYYDGKEVYQFMGKHEGILSEKALGEDTEKKWSDLWYIFKPYGYDKTLAQMTEEERANRVTYESISSMKEFANWYRKNKEVVILENEIKQDLKDYIEKEIFPLYGKNEKGHGIEHIYSVINRSLKIAKEYNADKNIAYTVAAYHDIGHHIDPKIHEKLSAEIFMKDNKIKKWFRKEEIEVIKEAIEDHRASSDHEPRSLYGKIVSTADRTIENIDTCIKRTYLYGKRNHPEKTEKEQIDRIYEHLNEKYGENGYAKTYLYDEEFQISKKAFIKALNDKETFMERVNKIVSEMKQEKE